jgi:ribosomal protein L39E
MLWERGNPCKQQLIILIVATLYGADGELTRRINSQSFLVVTSPLVTVTRCNRHWRKSKILRNICVQEWVLFQFVNVTVIFMVSRKRTKDPCLRSGLCIHSTVYWYNETRVNKRLPIWIRTEPLFIETWFFIVPFVCSRFVGYLTTLYELKCLLCALCCGMMIMNYGMERV